MKTWLHKTLGLPCFKVSGREWAVTATRGGETVLIATGQGTAYFLDASAWPNTPTVYAGVENGVDTTSTLTRRALYPRFVTDQWGRHPTPIIWQGDDTTTYDQGVTVAHPPARDYPIARYTTKTKVEGKLTALTEGEATHQLRHLVQTPQPLWLVYDRTDDTIPDSDVPPTRLVGLTSAPTSQVTSRIDRMERAWDLSYTLLDPMVAGITPLVTYEEATAHNFKFGDGSYEQAAREITGMP